MRALLLSVLLASLVGVMLIPNVFAENVPSWIKNNADLSGADLSDSNLRGADLSYANLSGADLTGVVVGENTILNCKNHPICLN